MVVQKYLNLVIGDERFQFLLKTTNTGLEGISHGVEIDRYEWEGVLNYGLVADLCVQSLNMFMQMDVEYQVCLQLLQISQA